MTDTAPGGASKTYATPVSWNSVQQELLAFVYKADASQLNARFVLEDSRNRVVTGPSIPLAASGWTAVRMPDAHIDPAYKIKKITVQALTPAGAPAYTGSVWLDHLMVKGVGVSLTDSKPTPYTTVELGYTWDTKQTVESRPNHAGALQNTTYTYDRYGMVTNVVEPGNHSSSASYDEELRLQSTTSEGSTTTLAYHQDSNQVKTITSTASGTSHEGIDTSTGDVEYSIDERNQKRRTENPPQDFLATLYVHDSAGNVTSIQTNRYAAGADLDANPMPAPQQLLWEKRYTYGTGGMMASMTDPNGNTTYFYYQAGTGYLTRIESPAGAGETGRRVTTFAVYADGNPSQASDPKGQMAAYEYDGLGRLKRTNYGVINGVPAFSTSYTYDPNGNVLTLADSTGTTNYSYDENDRLLSESRTQNGVTKTSTYTYYANGERQNMTPPGGGIVTYGYNAAGELISQTDPKNGNQVITFSHDLTQRLRTSTFPSGIYRQERYDAAGRTTSITLKNSVGTTLQSFVYDYGLDANGNPTDQYQNGFALSVTELDASTVRYSYDDLNRLVSAVRTGTHPYNHSYRYDANDNRTRATINGVQTDANYDAANQLVSQGGVAYTYDRNGNLVAYSGNSLSYNAQNKWTGGTVNGHSLTFGYDGQGRRVSRTVDAGRTDYWYDQTGPTLEMGASSATYLRGQNGELLSRTRNGYLVNYGTDSLGSIRGLTDTNGVLVGAYTYDPWGEEIGNTAGGWYNPYRYTGTYQDTDTELYQMGARYYQPTSGRFT